MLMAMVVMAGILVLSSARSHIRSTGTAECRESKEDCGRKPQGEFSIWESLSRALMTSTQY